MPYPPPERQPLRPVTAWGLRGASLAAVLLAASGGAYLVYRATLTPPAGGDPLPEAGGGVPAPREPAMDALEASSPSALDLAPPPYAAPLRAIGCDRSTVMDLGAGSDARDSGAPPPSSANLPSDVMVACEIAKGATRPGCDEVSAAYVASGSVPKGAASYVVMVAQVGADHPACHARYTSDGGVP